MKCTFKKKQFHGREYIGANEKDELYKGWLVGLFGFMAYQPLLVI